MNSQMINKKGVLAAMRAVVLLTVVLFLAACAQEEAVTPSPTSPPAVVTDEPTEAAEEPASPEAAPTEAGPVTLESGGEVPFYARFGRGDLYHDEEWAVIVFYRPPDCIPEEFNLLNFFDPGAFDCGPATTTSVEIWENGPDVDIGPLQAEVEGRGSVPIWFVAWPELEAAMVDDKVTIGELASLPSRLVGLAASYAEFIRPYPPNQESEITFTAEGNLDKDGAFSIDIHQEEAVPENDYSEIELSEADSTEGGAVTTDTEVPFYARFGRYDLYHDEEWAVIVFYRPPDCVPEEFNMLDFFDPPTAFDCGPMTTTSITLWETGPNVDMGPVQAEVEGRGSVPIWFVSWPELESTMDDDEVSIGELESLPSRLVGTAASYSEFIRPSETNLDGGEIAFTAEGALENGGAFSIDIHQEEMAPENSYAEIEISG